MQLKMRWACGLSLGVLACWGNAAHGSTSYSYFYTAGQSSYTNVAPNGTINVPLYLQEVNSDNSANSLLSSEGGLYAAGLSVALYLSTGSTSSTITGILANSGIPTSGFDKILDQSSTGLSADVLEQLNFSDSQGVVAGPQINGVSNVFLGTLSVAASSLSFETTTFTIGAYDPNNGNTVTFDSGYDLDNNADPMNPPGASSSYSSAAPTNFSITTTPEPASLSLLLATGMMLLRRHRRFGAPR